jgi:hypothetical protein
MSAEQWAVARQAKREQARSHRETLRKTRPDDYLYRSVKISAKALGLDPAAVVELFEINGNVCEACGTGGTTQLRGRVQVDHCHMRGVFRGFLCGDCNRIAGAAGDSAERLEAIARYLRDRPLAELMEIDEESEGT